MTKIKHYITIVGDNDIESPKRYVTFLFIEQYECLQEDRLHLAHDPENLG